MIPHSFARLAFCLSIVAVSGRAQKPRPFTGTWKLDMDKSKFSQKPTKYEVGNGVFACLSCDPPYSLKADGTDQPMSGHPGYDTVSARLTDDHSMEQVGKKAGKIAFSSKITVAADRNTAVMEFANYYPSTEKPVTGTMTLKRVGTDVPGMHALSGSWVPSGADFSEEAKLISFEQTADRLRMKQATGEHFDAKLDGKPYPWEGSPEQDTVILKRIGPREIEETDKLGEKVTGTSRMTVSPDGRTMTMVVTEPVRGASTFVLRKQ